MPNQVHKQSAHTINVPKGVYQVQLPLFSDGAPGVQVQGIATAEIFLWAKVKAAARQ